MVLSTGSYQKQYSHMEAAEKCFQDDSGWILTAC
jgi:hypothetical protein